MEAKGTSQPRELGSETDLKEMKKRARRGRENLRDQSCAFSTVGQLG
jgi:hypothetical protein